MGRQGMQQKAIRTEELPLCGMNVSESAGSERPMGITFYLISALTVCGGLAAVLLKNLVHCALAVTVAFAGLALLFLQLDAQFAGFAQILVYIGAVAILVVFAILLTRGSDTPKDGVFSQTWLAGLVIAAAVFAVLGWAVLAERAVRCRTMTARRA